MSHSTSKRNEEPILICWVILILSECNNANCDKMLKSSFIIDSLDVDVF